ncbi:MAG: DUF2520 domain-containing protein [Acidimicrobiia bacterium]|nr:DUF2520 domain-containing protein [Acidimicrobiia bacterium]NNC74255.1 DUF2520 domain-containing protein [Acidimicrobiia bacterium]
MRIVVVGPGRAGGAIALAADAASHDVAAIVGRTTAAAAGLAERVGAEPLAVGTVLPPADLLIVAVRDDELGGVAGQLVPAVGDIDNAVHVSGMKPVSVLVPLDHVGVRVGAFHPLQTLPDADAGAKRLPGAWVALTASDLELHALLVLLAGSLGMHAFDLADEHRAVYHAAAAAAANFPVAALALAEDLFAAAGVPFAAARPLSEAVISNVFDLGPRVALTGPVARGDNDTVHRQIEAVSESAPEWRGAFLAFVRALARISGRLHEYEDML